MITKELQQELFEKYKTPPHVIRHCNAVADVAVKVAEALNEAGYELDIDLIRGSAMIHDFVRVEKNHDVLGSELLKEMGYDREAEIVLHHMKYFPFNEVEDINEQDVVCLADRVVCEDEYVGADKRMEYLRAKAVAQSKPGWEEKIEFVRQELKRFIGEVEGVLGKSLDEVING